MEEPFKSLLILGKIMEGISFYNYAAVVKNLRGVIYWKGKEKLDWLLSRFRYRYLGLVPSMHGMITGRKNIIDLYYPNERIRDAKDVISKELGEKLSEAICLSSVYICPIITNAPDDFLDLSVSEVKTKEELGDRDWRLHLRIADYTVLDFYTWAVRQAYEGLKEGKDMEEVLRERREKIERDKRRYWRISGRGEKTFLFYLDPLELVYRRKLLEDMIAIGDDVFALFGIVAVVVV